MSTLIRAEVAQRLRDLFTTAAAADGNALEGVLIVDDPMTQEQREWVHIGEMTGTVTINKMRPVPLPVQDDFTVQVIAGVNNPGQTLIAAQRRVEAIVSALLDVVLADPGLNSPTPLATGWMGVQGVEVNGPDAAYVDTQAGWSASAVLTLSCSLRRA